MHECYLRVAIKNALKNLQNLMINIENQKNKLYFLIKIFTRFYYT